MTIRKYYQELALRTLKPGLDFNGKLLTAGLGLVGEIGEIRIPVVDRAETQDEISDTAWYVAIACHVCNLCFYQVLDQSLAILHNMDSPPTLDNLLETHRLMLIEASRVAEHAKKVVLHEHSLDKRLMSVAIHELVFWLCDLCLMLGFSIDEVLEANICKLRSRYPDGWSTERSLHRDEHATEPLTPEQAR